MKRSKVSIVPPVGGGGSLSRLSPLLEVPWWRWGVKAGPWPPGCQPRLPECSARLWYKDTCAGHLSLPRCRRGCLSCFSRGTEAREVEIVLQGHRGSPEQGRALTETLNPAL